jgi:hypothetical protein
MRRSRVAGVVVTAAIALAALTPSAALADANDNASCLGIISSRVSPPGSSGPAVEGRAYIAHLAKGVADSLGLPSPGAYTSYVAHFRGVEIGPECS